MISITLEGVLGEKLGSTWNLEVNSVLEIFEAIEANTNKITRYFRELTKTFTHFIVYVGEKPVPAHLLKSKIFNDGDQVRIVPIIQGGSVFTVVGIILMVLSMVLAIVLSPKAPKDVKTNSTILGGVKNVLNRNIVVPVGYGRLRIGSAVITNDIVVVRNLNSSHNLVVSMIDRT